MNSEYTPPDTTIHQSTDGKVKTIHPHSNLSKVFNPYIVLALRHEGLEQDHISNSPCVDDPIPPDPKNTFKSTTPNRPADSAKEMTFEGGMHRIEHDSFGPIAIPTSAYWSTSTQRCLDHFNIDPTLDFIKQSYQSNPPQVFLLNLLIIKKAVCLTHLNLQRNLQQTQTTLPNPQITQQSMNDSAGSILDQPSHDILPPTQNPVEIIPLYKLRAMLWAIDHIIHTPQILFDHFPLPLVQTGSLTHLHMNMNEVIATIANQVIVDSIQYHYHTGHCEQYFSTHLAPKLAAIDAVSENCGAEVEAGAGAQPTHKTNSTSQDFREDQLLGSSIDTLTFHPLTSQYHLVLLDLFEILPHNQRNALLLALYSQSSTQHQQQPVSSAPSPAPFPQNEQRVKIDSNFCFKYVQRVEANDDVNACQSTNCVIPTATRLTILFSLEQMLEKLYYLACAIQTLAEKDENHNGVMKLGRTHGQVATPVRLYDELMAYYYQLTSLYRNIVNFLPNLNILPIGGTAVGTGVNSYEGFDTAVCVELSKLCGKEFESTSRSITHPLLNVDNASTPPTTYPHTTPTYNTTTSLQYGKRLTSKYELMSSLNDEVMVSSMLSTLASCLSKFGQDLRFLAAPGSGSSGNELLDASYTNQPRKHRQMQFQHNLDRHPAPLHGDDDMVHRLFLEPEYKLKQLESGSSIMPNKSNPTQIEQLLMTCQRVMANHFILLQSNTLGQMQFNATRPSVLSALLESVELLTHSMSIFTTHCVSLLEFNTNAMNLIVNHSLMISTLLTPILGYKYISGVVKQCVEQKVNLWDILIKDGHASSKEDFFERYLSNRELLVTPTPIDAFIHQRKQRIDAFENNLQKLEAPPSESSSSSSTSQGPPTNNQTHDERSRELVRKFIHQQFRARPARFKRNPLENELDPAAINTVQPRTDVDDGKQDQ